MSNTLIKRSDGTYKHVLCMTWFDKSTLQLASVSRCIEDTRWFREQCQMHIFHFENMLYCIYIYTCKVVYRRKRWNVSRNGVAI